ncbi:MAG: T9SS type A sorting domain-containing protein [Chitinophagaceae bacterium]|nr:T9SS type A sorting domain-containing protein [Chitinophagaceae bacterium]
MEWKSYLATFTDNVFAYPNPSATGKFLLADASPNAPICRGNVYDMQGRLLKSLTLHDDVIDLSDLQSGVYFLHYQRNKIAKRKLNVMLREILLCGRR